MPTSTDGGAGLSIDISASLGAIKDTMDKIHRFLTANPVQTPLVRPILGAYVAAAAALTYGFMDCGGPPAGWVREIRWFHVWGADPFTAITGTMVPMIMGAGQYQDTSTEPSAFTQVAGVSAAIPNRFSAAHNELTLRFPQHLFIVFKSLGNNVAVNCFGQAWDHSESTRQSEPV